MFVGSFTAQASTLQIASTSTASTPVALPGKGTVVRIVNYGPNNVYVALAATATSALAPVVGTPTAAGTSCPVMAGTDVSFTINGNAAFVSAISPAGTATLDIQIGEGQ